MYGKFICIIGIVLLILGCLSLGSSKSTDKIQVKVVLLLWGSKDGKPKSPSEISVIDTNKYPEHVKLYLNPSNVIESDSQVIRDVANNILQNVEDKTNARDITYAVYDWMRKNIYADTTSDLYEGTEMTNWTYWHRTAEQTLTFGKGTDVGHARLSTALLRCMNIPARPSYVYCHEVTEYWSQPPSSPGYWTIMDTYLGNLTYPYETPLYKDFGWTETDFFKTIYSINPMAWHPLTELDTEPISWIPHQTFRVQWQFLSKWYNNTEKTTAEKDYTYAVQTGKLNVSSITDYMKLYMLIKQLSEDWYQVVVNGFNFTSDKSVSINVKFMIPWQQPYYKVISHDIWTNKPERLIDVNVDVVEDIVTGEKWAHYIIRFSNVGINYPDIKLTTNDLKISPFNPVVNSTILIQPKINNIGTVDTKKFVVGLFVDNKFIDSKNISIPHNTVVIANFTWVAEKSGVYEVTIKSDLYNDIIEIDETNNNISIRIEVKPLPGVKPDFAVTNIVCSKDNPIENENVVITTNIQSTNITASYGVIVELLVDFTHIDKTVLSIEENNTYTVKFRWTAIAGNHTLTIEVDPENLYTEIDETNNNLTITLTVGMTALSDLTISEIKFIPPRVEEGDTIYILATLQNIGTFDAKNVLITAYHDKIDNSTLIGSVTIDIPQNSKVVIEFIWTAEVGEHIIYLIIDERDTIHETIETNNKVSKNIVVDMKETYTPPPKEKDTDEYPTELWIVIGVILTLLIVHILMDVFRRSKRKKTKLRIYKFAMGNVFRRRSLAAVTILAVVIGIGMYAVIAPMMESMELEMQETMRAFGDITVLQANRTIIDSQIPEYLVSDIENITGVKCAHPFIEYMLFYPGFAEDIYFPMMSWYLGVDIEKNIREDSYLAHITKGRVCRKGANEVVMGWRLKEISEIDVGQRIKLGTVEYEIVGMYNTGVTIADMNLLTSLETARNNPVIAQHIQGKNVTGISVTVLNAEDTPRIANDIKNNVTTPWGPLDVSFPEDLVKKATEGMKTVENTVNMLLLIILGASFMIVTSILYTNIKEREREFAMNKAVGWSNRDVLWCVVVEVLILCLIGGILGAIFGTLLSIYIQSYLQFGSIFISLKSIVGALVIAIILGVLAGLYPGWKASKVRPALVLREG